VTLFFTLPGVLSFGDFAPIPETNSYDYLSYACSAAQIDNIPVGVDVIQWHTCSDQELGWKSDNCSCCVPDDLISELDFRGLMYEKPICDGLATSLDEGVIDKATIGFMAGIGVNFNTVTWAALTDAQRMGHRVQAYTLNPSLNGAVADETTFHSIDNHTKALLAGFIGGIQGAEGLAKAEVMNATCSALGATLSVVGACGLTLNANLSSYTTADYRTIMRSFINSGPSGLNLATTNVWPVDNAGDPATGATTWTATTWDAASDAAKDEAVRVFSRYNAVNDALVTAFGSQDVVDGFYGAFDAKMVAFSSLAPTISKNYPASSHRSGSSL